MGADSLLITTTTSTGMTIKISRNLQRPHLVNLIATDEQNRLFLAKPAITIETAMITTGQMGLEEMEEHESLNDQEEAMKRFGPKEG